MANPTVPRGPKVCGYCQRLYRPRWNYARSQYCTRACAHAARPRLSRVLAGRKAAQTKADDRARRLQNIRRQEYRRGYSDGYEQALQDMAQARRTA